MTAEADVVPAVSRDLVDLLGEVRRLRSGTPRRSAPRTTARAGRAAITSRIEVEGVFQFARPVIESG